MTDIHPFRPFGTYQSFYPYYLPRFYADYYPKSFQKYYYEPIPKTNIFVGTPKVIVEHKKRRTWLWILVIFIVATTVWFWSKSKK